MDSKIARGMTLAAVLAACWIGAEAACGEQIRILRKSGTVATASEIVKDDAGEFRYKAPGASAPQALDSTDVLDVVWESADPLYHGALELIQQGEFDNAIRSLEGLLAKTDDPIFRPYVERALIEAHVRAGDAENGSSHNQKAIELAEQFLASRPDARLAGQVRLLLGRAQSQAGRHDAAEATLTALENEARSLYGIDLEIRAKHQRARNFEREGSQSQARNLYGSLASSAGRAAREAKEGSLLRREMEELQRVGRIREGIAILEGGDPAGAETYFQRILREGERADDRSLVAAAHNGLGIVALRQDKPKEARFQFLSVTVKYFDDPREVLQALYWLGECYEKLDGVEPGARAKADEYYREVIERNRTSRLNSPWADKAKQKI